METDRLNNDDQALIDLALAEDLGQPFIDVTSASLWSELDQQRVTAKIISKHDEPIIFSGVPLITALIQRFTDGCQVTHCCHDGDKIMPGEVLLMLEGESRVLTMIERTLLNFLQHLIAISTLTNKFVDKVKHTSAKILDTRKTIPGWRHLAKYAVQCGGGMNHRLGLYDVIMVKDSHIDALGGIVATLKKLPDDILQRYPVIVEVRDQLELEKAIEWGGDKISRVLLDNMTPQQLRQCVNSCRNIFPTEASGGVNLSNVVAIAESGVDFISIGQITHSATAVDLSMIVDQ